MLNIKINTHGHDELMPTQHGEWIDLYTAEDVVMRKGSMSPISLVVSMQLPEGYYAEIAPRSSTPLRYGIIMANSIAIIENNYCGDNDIWHFIALAMWDTEIPRGTKICQFRLVKQPEPVEFEKVDKLNNPDRGGIGSTGW